MRLFIYFFVVLLCNEILLAGFLELGNAAGIIYDKNQDIYISKHDAVQRIFGYNRLFDFFAPLGSMIIHAEPVIFNHDEKVYMIEMWKGQYYASSGAEIGVYTWNGISWDAAKNDDMLPMAYTLKCKEEKLFERQDKHWWLSGFFPGIFSEPEDLIMDNIYIQFKNSSMRDAFLRSLYVLGYEDAKDRIIAPKQADFIVFTFSFPKSEQFGSRFGRWFFQIQNRIAVRKYNDKKAHHGRIDNSPETIDIILGLPKASNK